MSKVVCIAEKNSIAKSVANILGGGRVHARNSTCKFIKNYDFDFELPWIDDENTNSVTMTAVAGHIFSSVFANGYEWNKCNPKELFTAPIIDEQNEDIAKNIVKEVRNASHLMIWTDCDREGECIGWEITQIAKNANPRLLDNNIYRAVFSHLERSHIIKAACNPQRLNMQAVDAVRTRIEIDLRAGFAFTRLLTNILKDKISNDPEYTIKNESKPIISYGTCQFPTLGFVVDRYERIQHFIPEKFWFLQLQLNNKDKKTIFQWERGRVFDRLSVLVLYDLCVECSFDNAEVIEISSNETKKYRPLPLTTVELQKNCSRFFKLTAKQSLDAAEKLYQKGFISYPRTETDVFSKNMDLQSLVDKQIDHPIWGSYAQCLMNNSNSNKFQFPRNGKHDDKAHPPIYPICCVKPNANLTCNEKHVYEYVVRHFLACCSQDAIGRASRIKLKWHTEIFTASGIEVLEENFLNIYPWVNWKSSEQLPNLQLHSMIKLSKVEMKSGETSPPKLMTESELIMLMDANGIGTDATIAEHIEKIQERQYIKSTVSGKQKVLQPTVLGRSLVHGFEEIGLEESFSKPFLRRDMELVLKDICEGKKSKREVLNHILSIYISCYDQTTAELNKLITIYNRIRQGVDLNSA